MIRSITANGFHMLGMPAVNQYQNVIPQYAALSKIP